MPSLFDPVQLGAVCLKNRIVMAPLTRTRATCDRMPNDLMRTYYSQRAGAGLIISEATSISPQAVGCPGTPGIWSSAQVQAWSKITQAVHNKGGKIFLQLWHVGRVSDPEYLNGAIPVAPSAIACDEYIDLSEPRRRYPVPRALRIDEIAAIRADFGEGARHAREAGFDGVEVHAGNGYLIDQFLHNGSNQRSDAYGGSLENRTRLLMEAVDACIGIWGEGRVGVHLSPRSTAHGMSDSDPANLFRYVAQSLGRRQLAFLFIREAWSKDSLMPELKRLFGGPIIANEGYDAQDVKNVLDSGHADAIAFGRHFIANPDLVARIRNEARLNEYDAASFYMTGAKGYTDYPCMAREDCDLDQADYRLVAGVGN
jgi:2,4-dienoyl-CoA reductase-like NADH-dependent reductase (Old Yellow Enzyme family)